MKALKIGAVVVAVLIAGLVIFLVTFDIGRYQGVIEEQAKAATGREITIGGLHLAVSLLPTVVVEDVVIANAEWGTRPQMVTIKRVEAQAALLPLLTGSIEVSRIRVNGADILLEVDKKGRANWDLKGGVPEAEKTAQPDVAAEQGPALSVGAIHGENLMLTYKDAKAGAETSVDLKSLVVRIDGPIQDLNISSVDLADLGVLHRQEKLSVNAAVGGLHMTASGKITDFGIKALEISEAKVTGKTESGPLDVSILKLELEADGDLDLEMVYNGETLKAQGTIASPATLKDGGVAIPTKLALEGFGLKGDVDLTIELGKTPPMVKGAVKILEIDLAKYNEKMEGDGKPNKGVSGPVFPRTPIPWDSLKQANADVQVTVTVLKLAGGQTVENVVVPLTLTDGKLNIKDASADVFGGKLATTLSANANDKSVNAKATVTSLTAETLATAFKVTDLVTQGPLDVAADVRGRGNSAHDIAATLSGSVIVGMGESRIRNAALNFVGAGVIMQVLNAINPMGKKDPYTVAKCAVVNFQVAHGVAKTENGIALVTDKMYMIANGNLNLGQETIDMVVKPTATKGIDIGLGKLVSAVKLRGPMTSPNIGLDAGGSAKAIGRIGAALFTGGASLLAEGLKDRAEASSADPCGAARTWHLK